MASCRSCHAQNRKRFARCASRACCVWGNQRPAVSNGPRRLLWGQRLTVSGGEHPAWLQRRGAEGRRSIPHWNALSWWVMVNGQRRGWRLASRFAFMLISCQFFWSSSPLKGLELLQPHLQKGVLACLSVTLKAAGLQTQMSFQLEFVLLKKAEIRQSKQCFNTVVMSWFNPQCLRSCVWNCLLALPQKAHAAPQSFAGPS